MFVANLQTVAYSLVTLTDYSDDSDLPVYQWRRQRDLGPQSSVHGIFLTRNLVFSRYKLALLRATDIFFVIYHPVF